MAERINVDVLGLSRAEARWLADVSVLGLAQIERDNGGLPPAVAALQAELKRFGSRTENWLVSGDREPADADDVLIVASSAGAIGASAAAWRLGVTAKCVRERCRRGVLGAVKDANGRWLVDADSVAAAAARRGKETHSGQEAFR